MTEIIKFIAILILSSFLDACFTLSIIYTERKKPIESALWTGAGYFISAINIIAYVSDRKLIVASVTGAMIGCFLVVNYM